MENLDNVKTKFSRNYLKEIIMPVGSCALYSENKLLEHLVGKNSFTMPATPFLALFTVAPTHEDGTGGTEASLGNYARITCPGASWGAAADGAIANTTAIVFATCSGANWGTMNGFALYDAITAGNMIIWGKIVTPKVIDIADTAKFAIGDFAVTLN